jgi:hypothetical protein
MAANGTFEGKGKTLHDACDDAWHKAKGKHGSGTWFEVTSIHVQGTNPLSDYRVVLAPQGP